MMDEAEAGRLKAVWIIGYDVLPTLSNKNVTRRAFRKLECVIVHDLFITETAKVSGHIFLPAASMFEKYGTLMNMPNVAFKGCAKPSNRRGMRVPIGGSPAPWRSAWDMQKGFVTILSNISGTKSGESGGKVRA